MSSSVYEGPAVLVDDNGREIPVEARLGVFSEPFVIDVDHGIERLAPGWRWWASSLEAEMPIGRQSRPWRLRMPDGREGTLYRIGRVSSDDPPNRLEVRGEGEAPWDWET